MFFATLVAAHPGHLLGEGRHRSVHLPSQDHHQRVQGERGQGGGHGPRRLELPQRAGQRGGRQSSSWERRRGAAGEANDDDTDANAIGSNDCWRQVAAQAEAAAPNSQISNSNSEGATVGSCTSSSSSSCSNSNPNSNSGSHPGSRSGPANSTSADDAPAAAATAAADATSASAWGPPTASARVPPPAATAVARLSSDVASSTQPAPAAASRWPHRGRLPGRSQLGRA